VDAAYPEHLREEIERYLEGMRKAGLNED